MDPSRETSKEKWHNVQTALLVAAGLKSKAKQSCNYTEWGAIRWIRASPFKSHFGPVIILGAINTGYVGCPGNRHTGL